MSEPEGRYSAGQRTSPPPERQPGRHEPKGAEAVETIVSHHIFWAMRGLAEHLDRLDYTGDYEPGQLQTT